MEKISKILCHNKETYYYLLANLLQKTAHYGVRVLLIGYLAGIAFNKSLEEAAYYLVTLSSIFIIGRVIGALVGDLLLGNKLSGIMGGLFETLGILLLLIPNQFTLYIAIGLISLGAGSYSINLTALFGKQYLSKNRLLDSAYTLFYTFIHLGAFLGTIIIGSIGLLNVKYGFILAAVCVAAGTIIFALLNEVETPIRYVNRFKEYPSRRKLIVLSIFFVSAFWLIYEFAGNNLSELQMKFSEDAFLNSTQTSWFSTFSDSFVLLIGIILSIYWSYFYSSQFVKISIGFVLTAIAFSLLIFVPELSIQGGQSSVIFALLALSAGEIFISPVICSILTKYADSKYLATHISLAKLPTLLLAFISSLIPNGILTTESTAIKLTSILLAGLGIVSFLLFGFLKAQRSRKIAVDF
jgi:proton-dependent oligopeptide transporter, POT family